jgi:CubicO group peptidase (beta-lactamase class C family)
MDSVGASSSWSWHGYAHSAVNVGGRPVPVVSGGAHWGGGLWISALDLARIGHLTLRGGRWGAEQVISRQWVEEMRTPCRAKPNYGLSWWLNDDRTVWPAAPATGRCARGNGGAHLLWIDPARDLVISSRWGAEVYLRAVTARIMTAVSTSQPPGARTRAHSLSPARWSAQ